MIEMLIGVLATSVIFAVMNKSRKASEAKAYQPVIISYEDHLKVPQHVLQKVEAPFLPTSQPAPSVDTSYEINSPTDVVVSFISDGKEQEPNNVMSKLNVLLGHEQLEQSNEMTMVEVQEYEGYSNNEEYQEYYDDATYKEANLTTEVLAFAQEMNGETAAAIVTSAADSDCTNVESIITSQGTPQPEIIEKVDCSNEQTHVKKSNDFLSIVRDSVLEAAAEIGPAKTPTIFEPTRLTTADWLLTEEDHTTVIPVVYDELATHMIADAQMGLQTWVCAIKGIEGQYLHIGDGSARTWVNAEKFLPYQTRKAQIGDIVMLEIHRIDEGIEIETFSTLGNYSWNEESIDGNVDEIISMCINTYNYEEHEIYKSYSNVSGY